MQNNKETYSMQRAPSQDTALIHLLMTSIKPYRRWLYLAIVMMVAASTLNVVPPYLLQQAIDGPIPNKEMDVLWQLTFLYGGTAIGLFVLTFGFTFCLQQAGQRALADLRCRLFNHIFKLDPDFHTKTPTGDLIARLTNDIDTLNAILSNSIVVILVEGLTLIVIIWVMFATNWRLALLSLAILPLLAVITIYFRKRIRESSYGEREAMARISGFMNEHLNGMTVIQLFGRQDESAAEFDGYNATYRKRLVELRWHSAVFLGVLEIMAAIALGIVLYGGGQGVLASWASLGTLIAFVQYTERAFQPVLRLSTQYNGIQIALGAAERIHQLLHTPAKIQSPAKPTPMPPLKGAIEMKDIHFHYVASEPVLRGVSLTIPAGQTVAIVGATGAGKSSMVSLLARNYDPQKGQILLDGVDIKSLDLADLRRGVAVVPQDPVCLAGTIRKNIRLYRDDVTEEEVHRAAELSNAAKFIEKLPGGYDFQVMSGGSNLSQGQRQLLALARALALTPDGVLVLDEATSSIDTATEILIQEALDRILKSRTSVVIAHRLSTIRNADRIIVMDFGKIVEDGDHATLLAQGGFYAGLHSHQVADPSESEVSSHS